MKDKLRDIAQLIKWRLSLVVVFSASMAYLWASDREVNTLVIWMLSIGGFFITGAANAFNQIFERNTDSLMRRTGNRPLPSGRMTLKQAYAVAFVLGMTGIVLLFQINGMSGWLGIIAVLTYAYMYTPLKRISSFAVLPGAIAGSIPVVIGVVAAEGKLTSAALLIFTLQFIWQFPHTWSIAWLQNEDYNKAGIKMLPTNNTGDRPAMLILFSTFLIIPSCILLYMYETAGIHVTWILAVAGMFLLLMAMSHYRRQTRKTALLFMLSCLAFLPLAFIVLVAEKFIW